MKLEKDLLNMLNQAFTPLLEKKVLEFRFFSYIFVKGSLTTSLLSCNALQEGKILYYFIVSDYVN